MELKKGLGTIRDNVTTLMQPVQSKSRKKAIVTLAKKHGISRSDAQFHQAVRIAQAQAQKR